MKKRIMHVVHSLNVGGLENGVVNLVNGMDKDRFANYICCMTKSGELAGKINDKEIKIIEMNKREGNDFSIPFRLARLFSKNCIDIVHTRNWGAIDGVLGAFLSRTPHTVHGEHGRDISDPNGLNKKRNFLRRAFVTILDKYITVSEDMKRWLVDLVGINEAKVKTIINGVDTVRFCPGGKSLVRLKLGFDSDNTFIGTVGRLDPVKDHDGLIRAFARLSVKHEDIKLIIIGDGPCRDDLKSLAESLMHHNKVRFLGERKDVPELMKLFDIFVLPSIAEGMSNTILEAMSTALPVVATRVGGNPELIVHRDTGLLVSEKDHNALAEALEFYLVNKSKIKEHGDAGRNRVLEKFSLERMISEYTDMYISILGEKS